jgi:hypothetical protein
MIHFTVEIKDNIDQVLNTTRTTSSAVWQTIPEREESTVQNNLLQTGKKKMKIFVKISEIVSIGE